MTTMDFDFNDDQRSLRDVVSGLLAKRSDSATVRALIDDGRTWDDKLWHSLAEELGLAGLMVPERLGGGGGDVVDLFVVQELLGEHLAMVPFLAGVLATEALLACADEDHQRDWLPALCAGVEQATLAVAEGRRAWVVEDTSVTMSNGTGVTVKGRKDRVLAADSASYFLVPARGHNGTVQLYRVESSAPGVSVVPGTPIDLTRPTFDVVFEDAPAEQVGTVASAGAVLARAELVGGLALAAEQIGAAGRCRDLAVEHARNRVQFDRPIGGFQSVKHRCADMHVAHLSSRASLRFAAWSLAANTGEAELAVRLAQARASEAFYRVARDLIQVLGGIGCTWEHDAHLYLKRALATRVLLGDRSRARRRASELIGLA